MGEHGGGCHCGNIRLILTTGVAPSQIEVRACQCSFCLKHGSRALADPAGSLIVSVADASRLQRYRFGLRTADYLICRECGVYVAAVTADGRRGIVVVNALDDRARFTSEPVPVNFDAEDKAERLARRRDRWMPVVVAPAGQGPAAREAS